MEKISRILPSSFRFQKADHSLNPPARPGAISLGRPEGALTTEDRVSIGRNHLTSNDLPLDQRYSVFKKSPYYSSVPSLENDLVQDE